MKNFLQPSRPCLSIMEGAVLFGINSNIVSHRKSAYTIGISINDIWN